MKMNNSNNLTNTIDYKAISGYAQAAATPFSVIGFFANVFLLFILIKHQIFGKTTYYLLRISVVSDIICNLTTACAYIMTAGVNVSYSDGQALCRCLMFIIMSSYGVSIMTLCVIGIDRYFVIVRPLSSFYRRFKYQFIGGLFALASIIAFGFTMPILFFISTYPDDVKLCDLTTITPALSYYLIISAIALYVIPALTLVITYSKIIIYMRNYVRPGERVTNLNDDNHKKKKFIKMLISITATYLLISWPFFATGVGIAITRRSLRQVRRLGLVYYLLAFFSFSTTADISVVNPFIYYKFDTAIRSKAKMHLSTIYNMAKSRILATDDISNNQSTRKIDVA